MQKAISYVFIFIIFFFLVISITGYFTNSNFNQETQWNVDYSRQVVWNVLFDLDSIPKRKNDVKDVEILGKYYDLYAWQENLGSDKFRKYRMVDVREPEYLKIEMTESSYNMTGTWDFTLTEDGNSTMIKLREESDLQSIWKKGIQFYLGRDFELNSWINYIRRGLFENLLSTS